MPTARLLKLEQLQLNWRFREVGLNLTASEIERTIAKVKVTQRYSDFKNGYRKIVSAFNKEYPRHRARRDLKYRFVRQRILWKKANASNPGALILTTTLQITNPSKSR